MVQYSGGILGCSTKKRYVLGVQKPKARKAPKISDPSQQQSDFKPSFAGLHLIRNHTPPPHKVLLQFNKQDSTTASLSL